MEIQSRELDGFVKGNLRYQQFINHLETFLQIFRLGEKEPLTPQPPGPVIS